MVALADPRRTAPDVVVAPDDHVRRFLAMCLVEARRYGDDDGIWVREVVQNARDAGATRITFALEPSLDGASHDVVIDDDGSGMSREAVGAQLLRLFSSTKGVAGSQAAGCFGVGFWSLLRARPRRIEVDTHSGDTALGVVVDVGGGAITERPPRRTSRGTTIRMVAPDNAPTMTELRAAIRHHAGMVRGIAGAPPPTLTLTTADGPVALNRPFSLDDCEGVVAHATIEGDGFSGFVGLSANPCVELFHHGLRVVAATSLSALAPSLRHRQRRGLGVVVRIDVPSMQVLVDRRTVVEDDTIRAVVDACGACAQRLERQVLDAAAPLPVTARLRYVVGRLGARVSLSVALLGLVALTVGGTVGGLGLRAALPNAAMTPTKTTTTATAHPPRTITEAAAHLGPPRIDVRGSDVSGFAIATRHISDDLAIEVLSVPDAVQGLRSSGPHRRQRRIDGTADEVVASAQLRASGVTALPSSQLLRPTRAVVDGQAIPIWLDDDGLPVIELTGAVRTVDVFYAVSPGPDWHVQLPTFDNPALAAIVAAVGAHRADEESVTAIATAVAGRVRYAASAQDAARFAADPRPFVDKALGLGIGDCDVINAVVVLALQQAGFEARLARGLVIRDDVVAAELHAWAEVKTADQWLTVDASPAFAVPLATSPPGPVATTSSGRAVPTTANGRATSDLALAPSSPAPSTGRGPKAARRLWPAAAAGITVIVIVGLWLWRRRRVRRHRALSRSHTDAEVTALIVAGLRGGGAADLGLFDRPILPTDDGPISLARARALAHQGRLAVGAPRAWVGRRVRCLAEDAPRYRALRAFLPAVPRLDDLDADLGSPRHPHGPLEEAQQRIDGALRGVDVRPGLGVGVREVHLETADGRTHHVIVGPDVIALAPADRWRAISERATTLWRLRDERGHT